MTPENFLCSQWTKIQAHPYYQQLQQLPRFQQIAIIIGLILGKLAIIFGLLYWLFGKIVVIGFFASILAGLATGLGAIPAIFFKNISEKLFSSLLGAAAGVMLAATAFSLLVPGMESGKIVWPNSHHGLLAVCFGMILGAVFLHIADQNLPHLDFDTIPDHHIDSLKKISLFIIAITIHNFPEGMSVGVSFGGGNLNNGIVLAIAIALQNIPEGLAVALPLIALGYNQWKAVGIATLTGLVEPIGGLLGVSMVTLFQPILPIAMGFAAGAMLFVISEEIIPETHSKGRSRYATFSLMIGFIVMMTLDNLLS
ncbi:MAG: hypothetical protein RL637_1479 [Pseudomonadota bacterium]|jgi:ZIP family zinc transporter